jgi:hypothetical protein
VAVKQIFWSGGRGEDLHIVNGAESVDLRSLLVIDDSVAGSKFATSLPVGVILIFIPYFISAPVAGLPNVRGNFGVQVNTDSGIVKVTQAVPRIRSFLIEANVQDTNIPPPNNTFSAFIRANAHGGIERIWLTPSEIHLHQNANQQRLTLLAEFTDGRMGQVNNIPGLAWATSAAGTVGVDAGTGKLTISAAAGDATITATLPAAYKVGPVAAAPAPTAKVFCLPPWNAPRIAKLLGGSAGMAVRSDVRNFVMLSEGFPSGDRGQFDKAAQAFADFMRNDISSRPFGLCSSRINFWTVFVESQENGTSHLTPLLPLSANKSKPVPDPLAATDVPVNPNSVHELVERVSYPTKDDRSKAGNMSAAAITAGFGTQTTEWTALYGAGLNTNLTEAIYKQWVGLADLRIPDERDTAFGLASGAWPNAQNPDAARSYHLHPFRTERAHIDQLLSALKEDASGTALGDLWGAGKASRPHVLFICLGGARGGGRSPGPEIIAASVETDQQPRIKKVGPGMRTELDPFVFPATISLDARGTFVHESAHSFSLKDEYGGASNFPASLEDEVKDVVNVQPVSKATTGAKIDPAKLKWNLPRIDRAAMLVKQPTVTAAGDVEITVVAGQAQFGLGAVVLLRQRPLSPTAKVSKEITVTDPSTAVADGERVKLHGPAGAVTAADFLKGSIAFVQKKAGAAKLNLIADEIAAHITTTGVALNTAFGTLATTPYVCVPKDSPEWSTHWTVQIATNIPADPAVPGKALKPFRPTRTSYIVGAYEGGRGYHCGVLHPTGICMMRQLEIPKTTKAAKPGIAYEFCAVCAHVLVDAIDPSKHADLDKNFIADRHYKAKR